MYLGIMLGTMMVASTTSWPIAWLGLEVNLMCFIQTVMSKPGMGRYGMVYFLCQSWGSLSALGGALGNSPWLITIGLVLKMGVIPCHFWGPLVIKNLEPLVMFTFLTWQKVGPLLLLSISMQTQQSKVLIILNAIGGSVFILFATDVPLIMLFSSLTQSAWLMSLIPHPHIMWTYFLIYVLILSSVLPSLQKSEKKWDLTMGLLNLGGLPPFSGFGAKVEALMSLGIMSHMVPLLISSVISLYAYLRLAMTYTPTISVGTPMILALTGGWVLIYPTS